MALEVTYEDEKGGESKGEKGEAVKEGDESEKVRRRGERYNERKVETGKKE